MREQGSDRNEAEAKQSIEGEPHGVLPPVRQRRRLQQRQGEEAAAQEGAAQAADLTISKLVAPSGAGDGGRESNQAVAAAN